jgi:putative acetyltransferase
MEITIRNATLQDAGILCEIHVSSIRGLGRSHHTEAEVEAWAGGRVPAQYEEQISDKHVIVAEQGPKVVGFGTLDLEEGIILQLYVHPDHAGRGIGALILDELLRLTRAAGHDGVRLNSSLNARDFYVRAGFQSGESCQHRFRSGGEITCIRMTRVLP